MKSLTRITLLLLLFWMPLMLKAQDENNKDKNSPIENRAKRKKAKKNWKESRIIERDNKKAIKEHHKKLQTKKTLKAMKKEKKKSNRYRANKKSNFFTRLFRKS